MSAIAFRLLEERVAQLEQIVGARPIGFSGPRLISAMLRLAAELSDVDMMPTGKRTPPEQARVRFAVMYAAREGLGYSLGRIGRALSLDHTSVLHGIRRATALRAADPVFDNLVAHLLVAFPRILAEPQPQEPAHHAHA